jgi:hypothetical protein
VTVQTSAQGIPVAVSEPIDQPLPHGESPVLPTLTQTVDTVLERWHIDDEWWREPITRRYVEVVLDGGAHLVLFEDMVTGTWFAQTP